MADHQTTLSFKFPWWWKKEWIKKIIMSSPRACLISDINCPEPGDRWLTVVEFPSDSDGMEYLMSLPHELEKHFVPKSSIKKPSPLSACAERTVRKGHSSMAKRTNYTGGRGHVKTDSEEVSKTPALTAKEINAARPFAEVLPQFSEAVKSRGKQKTPTKELISLRLNRDTIASFRALGPGWQSEIDKVLTHAAQKLARTAE